MQTATSGSRREADELLRRARAAIKEDNLPLARWCLERAEKMDVEYDGLFQRFGDTPDKVRRDLERLEHGSPSRMTGDTNNGLQTLASLSAPRCPNRRSPRRRRPPYLRRLARRRQAS